MLQFPDSHTHTHTHTHTHLAPDESVARPPPHTHTYTRLQTCVTCQTRHEGADHPDLTLEWAEPHFPASCRYYPHFLWMWRHGTRVQKHSGFVCWSVFLSLSMMLCSESWGTLIRCFIRGEAHVWYFRSRLATAAAASVHSDPAAGQRSSHSSQERSEPEIWNTAWDFKTSGIRESVLTLTLYSLTHKEESGTFQSGIVRIQTAQTEQ